jgi:hypothetical protein
VNVMVQGSHKRKLVLGVSLAAVSLLAIPFGLRGARARVPARTAAAAAAPAPPAVPPAPAAPRCEFDIGETAAFTFESTARDVRAKEEDHFRGALSWQVVERLSATRWRMQAALSGVSHRQALTAPGERVEGPLTEPFFVDVDSSCRFVDFGYARSWDARRRQLVQSMLLTHEFVLPATPGAQRWSAAQSDGMGQFEASYELASGGQGAPLRIRRRKAAYEGQARARAVGLSVAVLSSEATATFDSDRPHWLTASSGLERVQVLVQSTVQADLVQRFRLVRDDARYVAMRAMAASDADFGDAFALEVNREQRADPGLARMSYDEALRTFLAHFNGKGEPSYAAARQLAAWLKAHPEGARRLVAALRVGSIDEAARPALFLGLELSGTDASRSALSGVLADKRFRTVDRARAASALSDIGAPTRATADLLLKQAQDDRDDMVANVSLLGLGSMARRSGDQELKAHVHASLDRELAAASESQSRVVLDAMGNSGDPSFASELDAHLDSGSASTRQHAAEALGRLDPAESGPRLLERLRTETDPAVGATMVGAYHGPATPDAIAVMSGRLASSGSVQERAALIAWLGAASRTDPAVRSLLVAQFHRETNARLMQQIGAFLPASALR